MNRLALLLFVAVLLTACQPAATPQPTALQPTNTPAPTSTSPPPSPAKTGIPASPTVPTPVLGPEKVATAIEQVAGKWRIKLAGGGGGDPAVFALAPDGTWSIDGVGGEHAGMKMDSGTYRFEGDVLVLESDTCLLAGAVQKFVHCTARYKALISMADGEPARLRLTVIDDPFIDRKNSLDQKTIFPYREQ